MTNLENSLSIVEPICPIENAAFHDAAFSIMPVAISRMVSKLVQYDFEREYFAGSNIKFRRGKSANPNLSLFNHAGFEIPVIKRRGIIKDVCSGSKEFSNQLFKLFPKAAFCFLDLNFANTKGSLKEHVIADLVTYEDKIGNASADKKFSARLCFDIDEDGNVELANWSSTIDGDFLDFFKCYRVGILANNRKTIDFKEGTIKLFHTVIYDTSKVYSYTRLGMQDIPVETNAERLSRFHNLTKLDLEPEDRLINNLCIFAIDNGIDWNNIDINDVRFLNTLFNFALERGK